MATARVINEKEYLKEVYSELEAIKNKVLALRSDLTSITGREGTMFREHDRHLLELAEYIDWKLQVLEKGTPFDWKAAGAAVESEVSVRPPELTSGPDFSGGYLGG
jgi:hypothetical protein